MRETIDLFLDNNKTLDKIKGSWGIYDFLKKSNALTCTMKKQSISAERVNLALDLIKNNTSTFSNFRGNNKISTAIMISLEDDIEGSLKEIISIYEKLKGKFYRSEYLIIAAQIIFNARFRVYIDDAINNTKVAYDYMKKNHRFLTGAEDIASAAIIATTSSNFEQTFNEIEECYEYLKEKKLSLKNNIQSLANILSLINLPSKDKCEKVIEMYSVLKENKVPIKDYYIPILGIISFLTDNNCIFVEKVAQVSEELKSYKGFGNFALGKAPRNMMAAVLVSIEYLESQDDDLKSSLIDSTNNVALTVIIAMQSAIMASTAAATAAAASASSSS